MRGSEAGVKAQGYRGERRLDYVASPQVRPVLAGELIERHQPFPIGNRSKNGVVDEADP
jgi:hypothetical protein